MTNNTSNEVNFGTTDRVEKTSRQLIHEYLLRQIDLGYFGIICGDAKNAPTSICGILVILLTITSSLLFLRYDMEGAVEFSKCMALPIISSALGYLFGKSK